MSDKNLKVALLALDINNDALWTTAGTPRLEVLGDGVTKKDVMRVAPQFSRGNPVLGLPNKIKAEDKPEEKEPKVESKKELQEKLAVIQKQKNDLIIEEKKVVASLDAIITREQGNRGANHIQKDIMRHLARQKKRREQSGG